MCNILAHDYFGVDEDIVRRAVHEHIPSLLAAMQGKVQPGVEN